jgi:hypothetical protein
MKLVEIKDVRVGQIRQIDYKTLLVINSACFRKYDCYNKSDNGKDIYIYNYSCNGSNIRYPLRNKLIGFLNITHRIEDNKLIEIPRGDFEVDDIVIELPVYHNEAIIVEGDDTPKAITYFEVTDCSIQISLDSVKRRKEFCKRVGILGVTHEFVNEKLITN